VRRVGVGFDFGWRTLRTLGVNDAAAHLRKSSRLWARRSVGDGSCRAFATVYVET